MYQSCVQSLVEGKIFTYSHRNIWLIVYSDYHFIISVMQGQRFLLDDIWFFSGIIFLTWYQSINQPVVLLCFAWAIELIVHSKITLIPSFLWGYFLKVAFFTTYVWLNLLLVLLWPGSEGLATFLPWIYGLSSCSLWGGCEPYFPWLLLPCISLLLGQGFTVGQLAGLAAQLLARSSPLSPALYCHYCSISVSTQPTELA